MKKIISGIQQIGVGVENLEVSWAWYRKYFGMNICIFEEKAIAEFMLHYTEGLPRERHAVLALNMQGGGGFEVWQHTGKKPQPPAESLHLGDLGINVCKMKTFDAEKARQYFLEQNLNVLSELVVSPDGVKNFFLSDPWGNIFQFVEHPFVFKKTEGVNGGTYGAIIGVSNIDKSFEVYRDLLNYETVVYDVTGVFDDFSNLKGGNESFRRVLLKHEQNRKGAFADMLGPTTIELIQVINKKPVCVFENRIWGDPGFIHLCFDIARFNLLRDESMAMGFPFTVDSTLKLVKTFDMGDAAGDFAYISDPDGTPIEFVETRKIPIFKKIGWYLKLYNRDPEKSLPHWMLRSLRFQKRK